MGQNTKINYTYIEIEKKDQITWIYLKRPPANTLNPELMRELRQTHQHIEEDEDSLGLILGSRMERFFCNGLDAEYIVAQKPAERKQTFRVFFETLEKIFLFPKPHISIIQGYAMGGGAVLALMSDFRYMAEGKGRICFSEVSVGLSIPDILLNIIRDIIHPRYLRQLAMEAYAFRPDEGAQAGLIDVVCPPEELAKTAEKKMRKLIKNYSQPALRETKKNIRKDLAEAWAKNVGHYIDEAEPFLGEEFEQRLRRLIKK